jgi:hypothetical protein
MRTPISYDELDQLYQDMLDDVYGDINICGYEYPASAVLRDVDPTAYRCGYVDYISSLLDDGIMVEIDGDNYWANDPDSDGWNSDSDT